MKKYKVDLWEETISFFSVHVEADSEDDARNKAWEELDRKRDLDYEDVGNGEINDIWELEEKE